MALKPIGYDLPQAADNKLLIPSELPRIDNTGVQLLQQAAQGTQQSVEFINRNLQTQVAAQQQTVQMFGAQAEQLARLSTMEAQARASNAAQTRQSWSQLLEGVQNLQQYNLRKEQLALEEDAKAQQERLRQQTEMARQHEDYLRQQAAQYKAQQEADAAKAVPALEQLRINWIQGDRFKTNGTAAYMQELQATLGQYNLSPEDVQKFTQQYAAPMLDFAKDQQSREQEYSQKLAEEQRKIRSAGLRTRLTAALGSLRAAVGQPGTILTERYEGVQAIISEFSQEGGDPLETATTIAEALDVTVRALGNTVDANADIVRLAAAHAQYAQYLAATKQEVLAGTVSTSEYEARARQKAIELGVPFYAPDPLVDVKFTQERLATARAIEGLQQEGALEAKEQTTVNTYTIGFVATQAVLSPSVRAQLEQGKDLDPSAREALRIVREFDEFRTKVLPEYRSREASLAVTLERDAFEFQQWLVRAVNGQGNQVVPLLEALRNQGLGIPVMEAGQKLSQDQVNMLTESFKRIQAAQLNKLRSDADTVRQRIEYFSQYGLTDSVPEIKKANQMFRQWGEQRQQQLRAIREAKTALPQNLPGMNPNFSGGVPGKTPVASPLAIRRYAGRDMVFPFDAAAANVIPEAFGGQLYGAGRGGARLHQGLDFAVPAGTAVRSVMYGTVIDVRTRINPATGRGYGKVVEVQGDDGNNYFYAHLQSQAVVRGQRVAAGTILGKSGDTGSPGSFHLHFEVLDKDGKHVNPADFLSALRTRVQAAPNSTARSVPMPRANPTAPARGYRPPPPSGRRYADNRVLANKGDTTTVPVLYDSVNATPVPNADDLRSITATQALTGFVPTQRDRAPAFTGFPISGGVPIGGGRWLRSDGSIIRQGQPPVATTPRQVQTITYVPTDKAAYQHSPDSNHGYSKLAAQMPFLRKLNETAKRLGIPGQWLADVIAHETENTFSPSIGNGYGHYGLIQFGAAALQDLGTTQEQLVRMTPVQQLTLVERYVRLHMQYAQVRDIRSAAELATLVFQGGGTLGEIRRRGPSAYNDRRYRDGAGVTLREYIDQLGKYTGRRYPDAVTPLERRRADLDIHVRPRQDCAFCTQMTAEDVFRSHRGVLA